MFDCEKELSSLENALNLLKQHTEKVLSLIHIYPIEENTYPMLVLPLRKIFVPSLVEIGPVVQEEMWKTPKNPQKNPIEKTPILCWFSLCVKYLCQVWLKSVQWFRWRRGRPQRIVSVSYTHLDVYKRQVLQID